MGWMTKVSLSDSWHGQEIFFQKHSDWFFGLPEPLFLWVPGLKLATHLHAVPRLGVL
jgi:hypothetical protein